MIKLEEAEGLPVLSRMRKVRNVMPEAFAHDRLSEVHRRLAVAALRMPPGKLAAGAYARTTDAARHGADMKGFGFGGIAYAARA